MGLNIHADFMLVNNYRLSCIVYSLIAKMLVKIRLCKLFQTLEHISCVLRRKHIHYAVRIGLVFGVVFSISLFWPFHLFSIFIEFGVDFFCRLDRLGEDRKNICIQWFVKLFSWFVDSEKLKCKLTLIENFNPRFLISKITSSPIIFVALVQVRIIVYFSCWSRDSLWK